MFAFLSAVVLLLVALAGITLRKTYYYLPPKELKRQAEQGDKLAGQLYGAVAYGASLRALLWIIVVCASAGGLLLLSNIAPPFFGFILIAVLLWLAFSWLPNTRVTAVGARLAVLCSPAITKVLSYLHPLLNRIAEPLHRHYQAVGHTGVYESDDLLELLERQEAQGDNRITANQLDGIKRALTAHQYKISDVLVPRSQVKTISDNDTIGLVLLDELHDSKQSSFPVRKGSGDKIVGTLYLRDLGLKTEGKVRDYMQSDVRYLHEDDSLHQALQAFYKTKHQLFVVVNSFEEYVGVVTLEHVLQQLAGEVRVDDFDQHDNLAAVAAKHEHDNEALELEEPEDAEPAAQETDEVTAPEPEGEVTEPEPEVELVTDEPPEEDEAVEEPEPEPDPIAAKLSMEDEAAEESVETSKVDPDNLAALDLPDEEPVPAPKPKKKTNTKTAKSDDEVVE